MVDRYIPAIGAVKSDDGAWVKYADYEALESKLAEANKRHETENNAYSLALLERNEALDTATFEHKRQELIWKRYDEEQLEHELTKRKLAEAREEIARLRKALEKIKSIDPKEHLSWHTIENMQQIAKAALEDSDEG